MSHHPHNQPGSAGPPVYYFDAPENQSRSFMGTFVNFLGAGQNTIRQPTDQDLLQGLFQQQSQMMEGMKAMSLELTSLRHEVNQVHEGNIRCEQKHTVSKENEKLRQENHDLQNECEKLRQLNQQLNDQVGNYVDLLTKSPIDHVMDQEVIHAFKDLRNSVYGTVTEVWTPVLNDLDSSGKTEYRSILESLVGQGSLSVARSQNHVCRIIFETLCKYIFNRTLFGHFDHAGGTAKYLQNVEHDFMEMVPKDNRKDVAQWRISTLKCADHFKPEAHTPAHEAEESILRKLKPVTFYDTKVESLAKKRLRQICKDALGLKLLMRKAEDKLVVRDFLGYELAGVSDYVSKFGDEPGDIDAPGDEIAFSRFGALLKYPIGETNRKPIMLEKAHALIYAKSPK
ncbi:hypothetical protein PG988_007118 [Apiospora saccharicola]